MLHRRSNLVERRLYEYTLQAVCSPLYVGEQGVTSDQLAGHVAKLFNVDPEEHEDKYMRALKLRPCVIVLLVDVKKARNLPGEDQNGLSDPYCKVSVVNNPNKVDKFHDPTSSSSSITPPPSPSQLKRNPSIFSCVSSSSSKNRLRPPPKTESRRSSKSSKSSGNRRRSLGDSSNVSSDKSRNGMVVSYRTNVQPKTINPEWNEHFEFEIENVCQQQLLITVFDSDRGRVPDMRTVVKEKRGMTQKFHGICTLLTTGHIDDDFLGQVMFDIRSLPHYDRDQWFPLVDANQNRLNNGKSRGEILLGLKVHFKLDDKISKDRRNPSSGTIAHFRRRHSTLSSMNPSASSIILRSSIFRKNFRPASVKVRDYAKTSMFDDNLQAHLNQADPCLTPTVESDRPLLIEEYHQLCRIVFLHRLEDAREQHEGQPQELVIDWNGALDELSSSVLTQFRVLYNISMLSESFIQLLVIMECRCSEDYVSFISQAVIEAYLKMFMTKVKRMTDSNDLDFTDYEKTAFVEVFRLFIYHYQQRVHSDAPWFVPSKENLPNIQSIFDTLSVLFQLKICSNETAISSLLEETIKARLQTDISDSFNVDTFVFNDKNDIQSPNVQQFVDYAGKLAESMTFIQEYNKIFGLFGVPYTKICFFEANSAGDRLAELTRCLLTTMTDYFQTYSKPMVKATTSIYDSNLIQSSGMLLHLYRYIQTIVTSLRDLLEPRDWAVNAFKLKLIEYRQWFSLIMKFLLEGFVAYIRRGMERAVDRAVEDESDPVCEEGVICYSQSAVSATKICIRMCQEWESVDYPEANVRYTAMIKLTNTICEQCQHYARRTARKLSENDYFTILDRTRSFNVSAKLCMLVNDIEYVKRNILSSLPTLLNFSTVIAKMAENYESTDFDQTRATLERLISTAEQEMTDVIKLIFEHVATLIHASLQTKITNYYRDEKRGKVDCMKDVINRYVDNEILQQLYKGLETVQYSRVACAIRIKTLQCLREQLPLQEPPDFYGRVLKSFDELATYFDDVCREESQILGPACEEVVTFRRTLQTHALTTEELQVLYFREVSQPHSPHDYPSSNGEIIFRAAHEIVNGLVTVTVLILGCRNLPKMDMIGASDPYVVLELLPFSLYRRPQKEYRTVIQKRTLNPEFNEKFHWHRLPLNVLHERGAVLHLSVWDEDLVNDDFIGECFVPLPSIVPLKNIASIHDVPVTEARLRRLRKSVQPKAFELIKNRANFDEEAAAFLKQRTAVMQSGNGSDGASVMSDDRNSSDRDPRFGDGYGGPALSNSDRPRHDSLQSACKNAGYQLWSVLKWKKDPNDTGTTENSDDD